MQTLVFSVNIAESCRHILTLWMLQVFNHRCLKNVHIECVCVAYDCLTTMNSFILVFDQCLYIPSLDVNPICVDQLRDHGLRVNDIPLIRLGAKERTNESHSIMCKETGLHIPLEFNKPVSYFKCRVPTPDEVKDDTHITTVHMTSSCLLYTSPSPRDS